MYRQVEFVETRPIALSPIANGPEFDPFDLSLEAVGDYYRDPVALTATIYNLHIHLSDMDRNVYENLELRIARQPSETMEYMMIRVIAYCLEYQEGMLLTEGVAAGNDPAIILRDLTGRTTAWIEVGMPDPERLHRGMKLAGRAAVYTHRDIRKLIDRLSAAKIHRAEEIPLYAIDRTFVDAVAERIDRRSELSISVSGREMYINIGDRNFTTSIVEHRIR